MRSLTKTAARTQARPAAKQRRFDYATRLRAVTQRGRLDPTWHGWTPFPDIWQDPLMSNAGRLLLSRLRTLPPAEKVAASWNRVLQKRDPWRIYVVDVPVARLARLCGLRRATVSLELHLLLAAGYIHFWRRGNQHRRSLFVLPARGVESPPRLPPSPRRRGRGPGGD